MGAANFSQIAEDFGVLQWLKIIAKEHNENEDYILENIDIVRFKRRIQMYTLEAICNANYSHLKSIKRK